MDSYRCDLGRVGGREHFEEELAGTGEDHLVTPDMVSGYEIYVGILVVGVVYWVDQDDVVEGFIIVEVVQTLF